MRSVYGCLKGRGRRSEGGGPAGSQGKRIRRGRQLIGDIIQKRGEDKGGRGRWKTDRWYIEGIPEKPICIASRLASDNVSSFPFCQIFTVHLTRLFLLYKALNGEQKGEGKQDDGSDRSFSDSPGKITANKSL